MIQTTTVEKKESFQKRLKNGYKWTSLSEFYDDFRNSLSENKSLWVWFYGIILPSFNSLVAVYLLFFSNSIQYLPGNIQTKLALTLILQLGFYWFIALAFLNGKSWAKKGMYSVPFVSAVLSGTILNNSDVAIQVIVLSFMPLIVYSCAMESLKIRLFFGENISDGKISDYWLKYGSGNKMAAICLAIPLFSFPLIGLFFSFLREIKLTFGVYKALLLIILIIVQITNIFLGINARREVNPKVIPPIGGKRYITWGIILSCVWIFLSLIEIYFD